MSAHRGVRADSPGQHVSMDVARFFLLSLSPSTLQPAADVGYLLLISTCPLAKKLRKTGEEENTKIKSEAS